MAFGTRIKKVAFAQATGIPQTYVERATGESVLYVPPQRDVEGTGFHMLLPPKTPVSTVEPPPPPPPPPPSNGWVDQAAFRGGRMGWWLYPSGQVVPGRQLTPPSRTAGLKWSLEKPSVLIGPDKFTGPPPPEVQRYDALPDTPPPGPAVPPQEPMWQALWRQAQEKFMGPSPEPGPSFVPERAFADAQPGAVAVAGFDVQKLILPLALVAGAFFFLRSR